MQKKKTRKGMASKDTKPQLAPVHGLLWRPAINITISRRITTRDVPPFYYSQSLIGVRQGITIPVKDC